MNTSEKTVITALVAILLVCGIYVLSWAATIGIIKLITLCFDWNFSFLAATGIWLIMVLSRTVFHVTINNKK